MITTAAKWFFGLGLVSFVLAVVYGYSTGGNRLGPLTAGYYGGVGDHLGYTLLIWLGSVQLGWHYVADGLAGILGMMLLWRLAGVIESNLGRNTAR